MSLPLDCWFQAAFRRLLLPRTLHALAGEDKVDGVQDAVFEHVLDVRRDRIGFKSFACARALCVRVWFRSTFGNLSVTPGPENVGEFVFWEKAIRVLV